MNPCFLSLHLNLPQGRNSRDWLSQWLSHLSSCVSTSQSGPGRQHSPGGDWRSSQMLCDRSWLSSSHPEAVDSTPSPSTIEPGSWLPALAPGANQLSKAGLTQVLWGPVWLPSRTPVPRRESGVLDLSQLIQDYQSQNQGSPRQTGQVGHPRWSLGARKRRIWDSL